MEQYHVKFFKYLTSSDGHPFKCLQRAIDVRLAKSRERAVATAKHRFKRAEHVPSWEIHADTLEVEVDVSVQPIGSAIEALSSRRQRWL